MLETHPVYSFFGLEGIYAISHTLSRPATPHYERMKEKHNDERPGQILILDNNNKEGEKCNWGQAIGMVVPKDLRSIHSLNEKGEDI